MPLKIAMSLEGALGAALVDLETGTCLPWSENGQSEDLSVAAFVNARALRAQMWLAKELKSNQKIEDLLITFDQKYYLMRPIQAEYENGSVFLFLTMDRKTANLALSRRKMAEIEEVIAERIDLDRRRSARCKTSTVQSPVNGERPAFMNDDNVMRLLGIASSQGVAEEQSLA